MFATGQRGPDTRPVLLLAVKVHFRCLFSADILNSEISKAAFSVSDEKRLIPDSDPFPFRFPGKKKTKKGKGRSERNYIDRPFVFFFV